MQAHRSTTTGLVRTTFSMGLCTRSLSKLGSELQVSFSLRDSSRSVMQAEARSLRDACPERVRAYRLSGTL
eukprot:scaffold597_cov242-Prasinococcus_capsulatus_cf.AAC.9